MNNDKARTREAITRALPFIEPGTELAEAAAAFLTTETISFQPGRYYPALDLTPGTARFIVHEVSYVLHDIYWCSRGDGEVEMEWVAHVFQALEAYEQHHSCGAH
jgi:hypothetical protein